jgi:hypothetical protein
MRRGVGQGSELLATDVSSGRSQPILPGVSMTGYIVSPHGKAIAYSTRADARGERGLWYAQLDQRSSPRNLVGGGVLGPAAIGASGDVFYTAQNGRGFRIAPDGKESRQIGAPLYAAHGGVTISMDERWSFRDGFAYPLSGRRPVTLCTNCGARWSPDGKAVLVSVRDLHRGAGVTVVIPLRSGAMLPAMPSEGIRGVDDLKKIPGAQVIPHQLISPGPAGSYVYTKRDTLRNLYRIPLP